MSRWMLLLTAALSLYGKSAQHDQARELIQNSNFKQAVQLLEKPAAKDPDDAQLLGEAWIELKEFGKAVDVLEKAAKLAPGSSMVQLWLGRAWGHRAENNKLMAFSWARKAKNAFEKSVELDPKNLAALSDLFEYYIEAPGIVGGGVDKAEAVAKKIAALDAAKGERLLARVRKERGQ